MLRNKKELIEEFINITNINKEEDGYREWEHYIDKTKEKEITDIIKAENLKEKDTLSYINNAFRDGEIKTFGVDFDKLLPPISRFSREENRQEKKNSIADKLIRFFEKFYNISWIIDIYKKTIDILQITGILLIRNFNLIYKGASYGYFRR